LRLSSKYSFFAVAGVGRFDAINLADGRGNVNGFWCALCVRKRSSVGRSDGRGRVKAEHPVRTNQEQPRV